MPSRRTKEDTWKEEELLDAIQGPDRKQKTSSSKTSKSGDSSKHRSKEEGRDKDRAKHRDSERREKDRRREKSESVERVHDDGEKSKRRHREEDRDKRKEDKEGSSRRKEDKVRAESEDERARRKAKEKEEKHRERTKDKESRREKERLDDVKSEKDKRRKHKSEDRERIGSKEEEDRKGKRSDKTEEKRKHKSSRKEGRDHSEERIHDSREEEIKGSSKLKDRKDRHKGRGKEEHGREDRHRSSKDGKKDKKRTHEQEKAESFRKKDLAKQESLQHLEEEIEEETASKQQNIAARKISILNTEEVNEEEIDTNEYDYADDDFEDYDDDFEDDDGDADPGMEKSQNASPSFEEMQGVDEIRKAMREENQLAESLNDSISSSRPSTRDELRGNLQQASSKDARSQPRGKINFIAAKQKQMTDKVASKTRRRGQELSKLIELDVVGMDIFELQPLNIYEVYMKSFGRMNTDQVAVQTNDDTLDQEVQTDEIETDTRWSQFSNEVQSFGGGKEKTSTAGSGHKAILKQDTRRLNKFLIKATRLCMTLLDEAVSDHDQIQKRYTKSPVKFSDRFQKLVLSNELIQGRKVVDIDVSQSNLMLAYGKYEKEKQEFTLQDGIMCIWRLNDTSKVQKYLSCGSTPKCCCFSPKKPTFAFAGMEDGSVSAWDLREADSMHTRRKVGKTEAVIRSETFSTASVYSAEAHSSSVVSIDAIVSPSDSSDSSNSTVDGSSTSGALQVISLDENGTVNIWVVIEVFSPDPGGSQQDLGLLPGGKMKLVKSGTILPNLPKRYISMDQVKICNATTLHVELTHAKSIYIGTDQGFMLHSSRFGDKVNPKYFDLNENDSRIEVSSIDHCPWDLPYILVGCTDGSVTLFNSRQGYPLVKWLLFSRGAGISKVQWSRSKPGVFFSLDKESYFYVWDLFASESGPVTKESIKANTSRAVDFRLTTNDSREKAQQLVVLFDDSTIEVHMLAESLSDTSAKTLNEVSARLEEIS